MFCVSCSEHVQLSVYLRVVMFVHDLCTQCACVWLHLKDVCFLDIVRVHMSHVCVCGCMVLTVCVGD